MAVRDDQNRGYNPNADVHSNTFWQSPPAGYQAVPPAQPVYGNGFSHPMMNFDDINLPEDVMVSIMEGRLMAMIHYQPHMPEGRSKWIVSFAPANSVPLGLRPIGYALSMVAGKKLMETLGEEAENVIVDHEKMAVDVMTAIKVNQAFLKRDKDGFWAGVYTIDEDADGNPTAEQIIMPEEVISIVSMTMMVPVRPQANQE